MVKPGAKREFERTKTGRLVSSNFKEKSSNKKLIKEKLNSLNKIKNIELKKEYLKKIIDSGVIKKLAESGYLKEITNLGKLDLLFSKSSAKESEKYLLELLKNDFYSKKEPSKYLEKKIVEIIENEQFRTQTFTGTLPSRPILIKLIEKGYLKNLINGGGNIPEIYAYGQKVFRGTKIDIAKKILNMGFGKKWVETIKEEMNSKFGSKHTFQIETIIKKGYIKDVEAVMSFNQMLKCVEIKTLLENGYFSRFIKGGPKYTIILARNGFLKELFDKSRVSFQDLFLSWENRQNRWIQELCKNEGYLKELTKAGYIDIALKSGTLSRKELIDLKRQALKQKSKK